MNAYDAPAFSAVPAAEELWVRLRRFLGQWGTVDDTARGLRLTWGEQLWVTEVQISQAELHAYVSDHVRWRTEHGLDEGLEDGLPLPLMDSFGDCFGPQDQPYARMELQGLDFRVVSDAAP